MCVASKLLRSGAWRRLLPGALLLAGWCWSPLLARADGFVAASDARLVYLGTWQRAGSTHYTIYTGSTLRLKVQGQARIELEPTAAAWARIQVRLLGQTNGTSFSPNTPITLGSPSATLEFEIVYQVCEDMIFNPALAGYTGDRWGVRGLTLLGNATLLQASRPAGGLRLEFFGDSITFGVSIVPTTPQYPVPTDGTRTFGFLTAAALGSEFRVRGYPGASIYDLPERLTNFMAGVALEPIPDPDYFFLNLGANDKNLSDEAYRAWLLEDLREIRQQFPASRIVVLNFFCQVPDRRAAILQTIGGSGLERVLFFNARTNLVGFTDNNLHPNAASHAALAGALVKWLRQGAPDAAAQTIKAYFQNPAGLVARWEIGNTGSVQRALPVGNAGGWVLKTAGDVDGDGVSDLLFQAPTGEAACWFMNANGTVRRVLNWGQAGLWQLQACADYEGDGRAEIFFQSPDGTVAYWRAAADGTVQSPGVLVQAGAWQLQAAGDVDGDGKAELFWQRPDGTVAAWLRDGNGAISGQVLDGVGRWKLCGVAGLADTVTGALCWQTEDALTAGWLVNANGTAHTICPWGRTAGWQLRAVGR